MRTSDNPTYQMHSSINIVASAVMDIPTIEIFINEREIADIRGCSPLRIKQNGSTWGPVTVRSLQPSPILEVLDKLFSLMAIQNARSCTPHEVEVVTEKGACSQEKRLATTSTDPKLHKIHVPAGCLKKPEKAI